MKKIIKGFGGGGGKGGDSGSTRAPTEAPDNLISEQYARVLDVLCEGEIEGLVDGLKSVYLDGTPVQNSDDTYNFSGVTVTARNGTQTQSYVSGTPGAEVTLTTNAGKVEYGTPVTRTITNNNTTSVRVAILIPRLTKQDVDTGDLKGYSVAYRIDINTDGGGFVKQYEGSIIGKTTTTYTKNHEFALDPSTTGWDVKVTRLSPDAPSSNIVNDMYWSTYTEVIDQKLSYPNTALVGLEVESSQFSRVPSRAYECKLLKINIPSNYDPITRSYTGIWDGSFTVAWSDNPAWCFYDLITDTRYGLGNYIDSDLVDKWTLYEIGQYCDELVDDGFGSTEPRFTCNILIQNRSNAYNVMKDLASVFRGMIYWSSLGIVPSQDAPTSIYTQFTNANVIDGTFTYEGTSSKARHNVALVSWNDPNDGYTKNIEYVEHQDNIADVGAINEIEVPALGCTSQGQAHRVGKWILYSEVNETELVTFQTSFDSVSMYPGMIFKTLDQYRTTKRVGGRITSYTTNSILIDNPIDIESGYVYTLSVVGSDGSLIDRTLTNTSGTDISELTFATSLSTTLVDNAIWVVSSDNISAQEWRAVSITEDEKNLFTIVGLEYNSSKYDYVEQDLKLEEKTYTLLNDVVTPVTDLTAEESLYEIAVGNYGTKIHLGWIGSANSARYIIEYKNDDDNYTKVETSNEQYEIENAGYGTFTFRVIAIDALGNPSKPTTLVQDILGVFEPPSDVTNFSDNVLGSTTYLSWDPVPDLDLDHYCIKYTPNIINPTWGTSSKVLGNLSKNTTFITVPVVGGSFLIKAVDNTDIESVNAAIVSNGINTLENYNAVLNIAEQTTFTGTHSNTVVNSGKLELTSSDTMSDWTTLEDVINLQYGISGISLAGSYVFDNTTPIDLGGIYTSRLTSDIIASGVSTTNYIVGWSNLSEVENLSGTDSSFWDVYLFVRTTEDDPNSSPTWSDWTPFIVGDYYARSFEFKLELSTEQSSVTPSVEKLEVNIDMPDRVYGEYDIDSDATAYPLGYPVIYNPAFKGEPAIAIAAQGLIAGDYYDITNKSSNGFTILFKDSGGNAKSIIFDYIAKGYGYVN